MTTVLCFGLCACSKETVAQNEAPSNQIGIEVANEVDGIAGMGVSYLIGDSAFHSTGTQHANGSEIGNETNVFYLMDSELPQDASLEDFGVTFSVTEKSGVEIAICTLHFPVQLGNTYSFKIMDEDGAYAVWSAIDQKIYSGVE